MNDTISRRTAIEACESIKRSAIIEDGEPLVRKSAVKYVLDNLPSAEPQIIQCKDCKHRDTEECPMRYEEWVPFEEDGYIDSDYVAHDQTRDDGFCDRGERGEQE